MKVPFEDDWKSAQDAALGDFVQWERDGRLYSGNIVLALNGARVTEVIETEPDETCHDTVLVREVYGRLVWVEDNTFTLRIEVEP